MAVEAGQSSKGTVRSELRENAVGLPGMLMQGIATIGPSFAILASFVFIVGFAGIVTPWAFLFGGILLGLQALSAAQLAKVFPSAGGWYTWIARAFHPRAGFFAGVLFSIWLPPVATLTMAYLAKTVLEPSIKAEYGVDIQWWIWVVAGVALVIFFAYQGISISEKALIITGLIEIVIMVATGVQRAGLTGQGRLQPAPRSTRPTSAWRATCSWAWSSRSSRSAAGSPPGRWPRRARTRSATCRSGWSARSPS